MPENSSVQRIKKEKIREKQEKQVERGGGLPRKMPPGPGDQAASDDTREQLKERLLTKLQHSSGDDKSPQKTDGGHLIGAGAKKRKIELAAHHSSTGPPSHSSHLAKAAASIQHPVPAVHGDAHSCAGEAGRPSGGRRTEDEDDDDDDEEEEVCVLTLCDDGLVEDEDHERERERDRDMKRQRKERERTEREAREQAREREEHAREARESVSQMRATHEQLELMQEHQEAAQATASASCQVGQERKRKVLEATHPPGRSEPLKTSKIPATRPYQHPFTPIATPVHTHQLTHKPASRYMASTGGGSKGFLGEERDVPTLQEDGYSAMPGSRNDGRLGEGGARDGSNMSQDMKRESGMSWARSVAGGERDSAANAGGDNGAESTRGGRGRGRGRVHGRGWGSEVEADGRWEVGSEQQARTYVFCVVIFESWCCVWVRVRLCGACIVFESPCRYCSRDQQSWLRHGSFPDSAQGFVVRISKVDHSQTVNLPSNTPDAMGWLRLVGSSKS